MRASNALRSAAGKASTVVIAIKGFGGGQHPIRRTDRLAPLRVLAVQQTLTLTRIELRKSHQFGDMLWPNGHRAVAGLIGPQNSEMALDDFGPEMNRRFRRHNPVTADQRVIGESHHWRQPPQGPH